MNNFSLRERIRYWFDEQMSKGAFTIVKLLLFVTFVIVFILAGSTIILGLSEGKDAPTIMWDSFSTLINSWVPSYEDGTFGYIMMLALNAIIGLLFASVLIGIITSGLEEKILALRKGNSKVIESGHTVILGFYPGEYTLIKQLILAAGKKKTCIVVADDMEKDEMEEYIKDNIDVPKTFKIVCRTVDIFDPSSIEKCSIETCKSVIISPTEDNRTIKALLAVSKLIKNNKSKVKVNAIISKNEYHFPKSIAKKHNITALQTNNTLAKMIAHSCTQMGLSETFQEVFNFEGSELYEITVLGIEGLTFNKLLLRMDNAVPLGIIRNKTVTINPDKHEVFKANDKVLVFSEEKDSFRLNNKSSSEEELLDLNVKTNRQKMEETSVVVIGSNETLPTVLYELPENVTLVTIVNFNGSQDEKELIEDCLKNKEISIQYIEKNLSRDVELLEVANLSEHIVILNDHSIDEEEADMQSIFLLINLRDIRANQKLKFNITAEMRREHNQNLVTSDDHTDFVVASNMSSLFLAQLSEGPELYNAFAEILSNEGNELYLKTALELNCAGEHSVLELRQILYKQGYLFLGYVDKENNNHFNPLLSEMIKLTDNDQIIVMGEK